MQNFSENYGLAKLISGVIGFGGIIALVGVLPIDSFEFYMFLRVVLFVSFVAAFFAMLAYIEERAEIFLIAPIGAFLFNPFSIIENDKSTWIVIDIITGVLLLFWASSIDKHLENEVKGKKEADQKINELLKELDHIKHTQGSAKHRYELTCMKIYYANIHPSKKEEFYAYAKEMYKQ